MYTVEGLLHGIERARHNIDVLEKAIAAERKTISDYRIMIAEIEEAARKKKEAEAGVTLVIDHGDSE